MSTGITPEEMEFSLRDMKKMVEGKLREPSIGARDFSQLTAAMVKIDQQLAESREDVWWQKVRALKEASEAIEELVLGDATKYKSLFDNGKKNNVFLTD